VSACAMRRSQGLVISRKNEKAREITRSAKS